MNWTPLDNAPAPFPPRIAVLPRPTPELTTAIARGGGVTVADSAEADGVVVDFALDPMDLDTELRTLDRSGVRWVQLPRSGVDLFLPAIVRRPDLTWTSAKGCYAESVAEHALTLVLALLRDVPERARAARWGEPSGRSLHGSRVVVVGAGGVGLEIVRLLRCFSTHVTVVRRRPIDVVTADRTLGVDQLPEALADADVVIVAAALTSRTRTLLGPREFQCLGPNAIVVNIARGELVDTDALVSALEAGQLAGVGLDVTDPEPLPCGHRLWRHPRALITPHTADTMAMRLPRFAERVTENVQRFGHHHPLIGAVDTAAGY